MDNKGIDRKTIERILELREQGLSYRKIGSELSVDCKVAHKYCILYGKEKIQESKPRKKFEEDQVEIVKELYLYRGLTPSEIAQDTNIPYNDVKTIIHSRKFRKGEQIIEKPKMIQTKLPPLKFQEEPIFYPDRELKPVKYTDRGKNYQDVSALFGL